MFTTTTSVFAAGFSQKKFLKQIEATINSKNSEEEKDKEHQSNPDEVFGEVNGTINEVEEEKEVEEPKEVSKKIVVKAHKRKGKDIKGFDRVFK